MNHDHHNHEEHEATESTPKEYAKFICIILGIVLISYFATSLTGEITAANFIRIFMGVFFSVSTLWLSATGASFTGLTFILITDWPKPPFPSPALNVNESRPLKLGLGEYATAPVAELNDANEPWAGAEIIE